MTIAASIQAAAARGAVPCDQCNADYRVQQHPEIPRVTMLTIVHDDDCSEYLRRQGANRAERRAARRPKK